MKILAFCYFSLGANPDSTLNEWVFCSSVYDRDFMLSLSFHDCNDEIAKIRI